MATNVTVPDIGDFSEVPVISVLVAVGDTIAAEDPLIELESDKATMEVPAPAAGTVAEIMVAEGDTVSEGALILTLETEGETAAKGADDTDTGAVAKEVTGTGGSDDPAPDTDPGPLAATETAAAKGPGSGPGQAASVAPPERDKTTGAVVDAGFGKAHASPSVRAFARNLGVDLGQVNGTGRKGRILREDVTAHFKSAAAPALGAGAGGGTGIPPIPAVDFSKFGPVEDVEMSRIKKISGPALHRSWLNIPHVTHHEEADITDLDVFRKELDTAAKKDGYRVTLLSFVIKASVHALKQHWEVNASIHPDGDRLIRKNYWNVGFAADTPNGLMVPVIKDADAKGIIDISKELGDLSAAARAGKLRSADMQGASFTISSLGGIGGTGFTPIVNAPEVAILGLTRSKMAPVWNGEAFVPRNMLPMSLSYDHRAIDGALAARFAATLKLALGDMRRVLL